jgi:hypothetical protein
MADRKASDPNAMQNALKTAEEFAKNYSGEAGKVLIKPKPKPQTVKKEGPFDKLKRGIKKLTGLVSNKNKENLGEQAAHAGTRVGNALTEEEYVKHYGRK